MKKLLIVFLLFASPFISSELTKSGLLFSQQEEMMEEGTQKKETPKVEIKKEEAKKEEIKKDQKPGEVKKEEPMLEEQKTIIQKSTDPDEEGVEVNRNVPENLRFYKEKYEFHFDKPFEVVWNAVKKALEETGCMIAQENYKATDEGLYKGVIKSDFCVFTAGKDTTFKTLNKYSYDLPVIRGGIWLNGRMQYTVVVREENNGKVYMQIKGELSGFEDFVTHEVHFWKSNGLFETRMGKKIEKNFNTVLKKE